MAYFRCGGGVPSSVKTLPTYKTASGSVATFETDMTENLISCVCDFSASGGGGTPDNPIAITGVSSVTVTANSTPYVCNLGDTYYGGTVDVVTGKCIITHNVLICGATGWSEIDTGIFRNSTFFPYNIGTATSNLDQLGMACENFLPKAPNISWSTMIDGTYGVLNTAIIMKDTSCADAMAFGIAVNGCKVVYPLSTPIEIDVSSISIPTINGTNNLFADTGDINCKYILSVGEALRQG